MKRIRGLVNQNVERIEPIQIETQHFTIKKMFTFTRAISLKISCRIL